VLADAIRALQARAKIAKLMAEDKIKDGECDVLLAYTPPAPEAAANDKDAEGEGGAQEEKSEKEAAEAK
jgi:hypothetical protein